MPVASTHAHEYPRSDLLQMLECSKRQPTNQSHLEQLTDSACSLDNPKRLSHDVRACPWTTLRAFVDGQTCLRPAQEFVHTNGVPPALIPFKGHRDVQAQSFEACSGSRFRKG